MMTRAGDMIRDVLLGVYALAWLIVILLTAWRNGEIDPILWATLGGGVGVIMGIFRVDDNQAKKKSHDEESGHDANQ
jgi:hypothetical protein